jgi:hypothetical protein
MLSGWGADRSMSSLYISVRGVLRFAQKTQAGTSEMVELEGQEWAVRSQMEESDM